MGFAQKSLLWGVVVAVALCCCASLYAQHAPTPDAMAAIPGAEAAHEAAAEHAISVGLHWVIPFAAMLLCIAILPLTNGHWWEHNSNKAKISLPLGVFMVICLLVSFGEDGWHKIEHTFVEYVQFIILLASLYIISGGIVLRGDLRATPKVNAVFLAIGAVIASFIGTTGASMLLIRPVLKTNSERKHVVHTVIFFIFMVSNLGGCLTPLGDPPLFLGFLKGVPFMWTFKLWPEWLLANGILLAVYFIWDTIAYAKEEKRDIREDKSHVEPLSLAGGINFLFLLGVVAAVAFSQTWAKITEDLFHIHSPWFHGGSPLRELIMIVMVVLSLRLTSKELRVANKFTYGPIIEVAVLFIGIFMTMIPALLYLGENGSKLGVDSPAKFFWTTGTLSSFLDNAPTYLTFFETARGMEAQGAFHGAYTTLVQGVPEALLVAISLGAVFMGANTYIGNGPNFMVKAVAEEAKVKMPSFFGYMLYSGLILVPLFVLITFLKFVWNVI